MKDDSEALPVAHTLWLSPSIGPIEAACLRSLVAVGHRVVVHCYHPPESLPKGVEVDDAAAILPREKVFRHRRSGRFAPFADKFRYLLLAGGADMWVDCDLYAIKPITRRDYLFGIEGTHVINQAVLSLPKHSELLSDLVRIVTDQWAPMPWLSRRRQWRARVRSWLSGEDRIAHLQWGATGPSALTYLAHKRGVANKAQPSDVFYPVHHGDLRRLLDPTARLEDLITSNTEAIHLYGTVLGPLILDGIPPGSPLSELLTR